VPRKADGVVQGHTRNREKNCRTGQNNSRPRAPGNRRRNLWPTSAQTKANSVPRKCQARSKQIHPLARAKEIPGPRKRNRRQKHEHSSHPQKAGVTTRTEIAGPLYTPRRRSRPRSTSPASSTRDGHLDLSGSASDLSAGGHRQVRELDHAGMNLLFVSIGMATEICLSCSVPASGLGFPPRNERPAEMILDRGHAAGP